jgi:hypothetical protein
MPIAAGPPVARCFPRSPGRLTFHLPTVFETLPALVHALSQFKQSADLCPCPNCGALGRPVNCDCPAEERVWSPCGDGIAARRIARLLGAPWNTKGSNVRDAELATASRRERPGRMVGLEQAVEVTWKLTVR